MDMGRGDGRGVILQKKKMIVRIELASLKMLDLMNNHGSHGNSGNSGGSDGSDGSGSSGSADSLNLPDLGISFGMNAVQAPGYSYSRSEYPAVGISFPYVADDSALIHAWLEGDYSSSLPAMSATLQKGLSTAVVGAVDDYYAVLSRASIFARPYKIGWAYRLSDGSRVMVSQPVQAMPDSLAPYLALQSHTIGESSVSAVVEIVSRPVCPTVIIPDSALSALQGNANATKVTHIDIYTTAGTPLHDKSAQSSGVRTISIGGKRRRCFIYQRYSQPEVETLLAADDDFRVVESIPIADFAAGTHLLNVTGGTLSDWKTFPKLSDGTGGSGDNPGDNPGDEKPTHFRMLTPALSLGSPEEMKWLRGVELRGVFQHSEVKMTLYGSHHREHWRTLAASRGSILRRLHGVRFRWFMVLIDLPLRPGDSVEALTFNVEF